MSEQEDLAGALEAVLERIRQMPVPPGDAWVIVEDDVAEFAEGWVIPWTSRLFAETGEIRHSPIGNGPMLVDRRSFDVIPIPSGLSTEEGIRRYSEWRALPVELRVHWSPLMVPDALIELVDCFARGADTSARQAARIVEWIDVHHVGSDALISLRRLLADFKAGRRSTSSNAARMACAEAMNALRPPVALPPCPRCGGQLGDHRKSLIRAGTRLACRDEATCGDCHAELIGHELAADGHVVWMLE